MRVQGVSFIQGLGYLRMYSEGRTNKIRLMPVNKSKTIVNAIANKAGGIFKDYSTSALHFKAME